MNWGVQPPKIPTLQIGHHGTLTISEMYETVHLNDKQKIFCSLQFFPDVAQNSLRIA